MVVKQELPLEHWVSYRFGRLCSKLGAVLGPMYAASDDLPAMAWRSLAVIERYGPLCARGLREKTGADPFRTSRALRLLMERGWIARAMDPKDRRKAQLRMTAKGRAFYARVGAATAAMEEFLSGALSESDLQRLHAILDKLDAKAQALAELGWKAFAPAGDPQRVESTAARAAAPLATPPGCPAQNRVQAP